MLISNQCNLALSQPAFVAVGPMVLVPPQSTTGQVCQTTLLSVQAIGVGSLTYRWRLNGSNLVNGAHVSGAQSSQLTLGPLIYALEGNYDVVVRNDCASLNSTTSAVARVTVTPQPTWVLRATNGPPGAATPWFTTACVT